MVERQISDFGRHEGDGDSAVRQPDPRILEEVLQRTILRSADSPATDEDIACLVPVAVDHPDKDVDEAMPHLVQAMLRRIFGSEMDSTWQTMTRTISESLLDDPTARLRAENLWQRLLATQA